MKLAHVALSGYCAVIAYLFLSLCFGPNGLLAYGGLSAEMAAIDDNLTSLRNHNADLNKRIGALTSSRETLLKESQKIGYYPKNARIIRFKDYDAQRTFYDAGTILQVRDRKTAPQWLLRFIAFTVGCGVFTWLCRKKRGRPRRR
jgi:hypothetical protein